MNPDEPVTSIFMTFTAHKKDWTRLLRAYSMHYLGENLQ